MKILIVSGHDRHRPVCGVFDHATRLAADLESKGHTVHLSRPADISQLGGWDVIHFHYVPHLYDPFRGLGALPIALRLRRAAPLVVTVHEPRVRYKLTLKQGTLAIAQHAYLETVIGLASAIIVPTSAWLPFVHDSKAAVIPVGSNLMERAGQKRKGTEAPRRIGVFSSGGLMAELAILACRRAAEANDLEILGVGVDRGDGIPYTGYLSPEGAAEALATLDLLVLPYPDGVSGRRTTFVAGLQVGTAVLTTLVPPMKDFTVEGFAHTRPSEKDDFVALAVLLSGDPKRLNALACGGRALFDAELSGSVIADRVVRVYESVLGSRP